MGAVDSKETEFMLRSLRFWAALGVTIVALALLVGGSSTQAQPNKPKPPKTA
ncbi:MAG: hypothetical protein QOH93_3494 [Chloroflexia bacterium]|jgi:hypothetical protein|nr:hypothetical protein [Chloroflexia bacterium]